MKSAKARAEAFATRPAGRITLMSEDPISQSGSSEHPTDHPDLAGNHGAVAQRTDAHRYVD